MVSTKYSHNMCLLINSQLVAISDLLQESSVVAYLEKDLCICKLQPFEDVI
jgi:hypothetical protein